MRARSRATDGVDKKRGSNTVATGSAAPESGIVHSTRLTNCRLKGSRRAVQAILKKECRFAMEP